MVTKDVRRDVPSCNSSKKALSRFYFDFEKSSCYNLENKTYVLSKLTRCYHFIPPDKHQKANSFWCFQGEYKMETLARNGCTFNATNEKEETYEINRRTNTNN